MHNSIYSAVIFPFLYLFLCAATPNLVLLHLSPSILFASYGLSILAWLVRWRILFVLLRDVTEYYETRLILQLCSALQLETKKLIFFAVSAHIDFGKQYCNAKCAADYIQLWRYSRTFVCLCFNIHLRAVSPVGSRVRVQVAGHRSAWKGNVSVHTALDPVYLLAVYPTDPLFTTSPQDICNPQKWHMKPSWFLFLPCLLILHLNC